MIRTATLLLLLSNLCAFAQQDLNWVRNQFLVADTKEKLERIVHAKVDCRSEEALTLAAYKAVCISKLALHTSLPWDKYQYFTQGRDKLESIIATQPSVEIRYLRLLTQINAPTIVMYDDNIDTDIQFILNKFESVDIPENYKAQMIESLIFFANEHPELNAFRPFQSKIKA
ncbi:MAG: hypothetical protein R2813_06600 [Flavobacteriales bacterium]